MPDPIVDFEASGFGHCFDTFWHVLRTHQNPAVKGLKHSRCYICEHVLAKTGGLLDSGIFRRHFWTLLGTCSTQKRNRVPMALSPFWVIFRNKIAAVLAKVLAQVLAVAVSESVSVCMVQGGKITGVSSLFQKELWRPMGYPPPALD